MATQPKDWSQNQPKRGRKAYVEYGAEKKHTLCEAGLEQEDEKNSGMVAEVLLTATQLSSATRTLHMPSAWDMKSFRRPTRSMVNHYMIASSSVSKNIQI